MAFSVSTQTRQEGKSFLTLCAIEHALHTGRQLLIGTANVDKLYDELKIKYPEAKLSKRKGYVIVN